MTEAYREKIRCAIKDFELRKSLNKERMANLNIEAKRCNIIFKDEEGQPCGSLCVLCFAETALDPFRNCSDGVKIDTICSHCVGDYHKIIDYLENNGLVFSKSQNAKKVKFEEVDWEKVEKCIDQGKTLTQIATMIACSNKIARQILDQKYGNKICYKKGRNGGVLWAKDTTIISAVETAAITGDTPMRKSVNVDWNKVDELLNNGEAKLAKLAKEHGVVTNVMRQMLIDRYGTGIEFKRGRNGGIKRTTTTTQPTTPTTQ
jgi:hypothetical protein